MSKWDMQRMKHPGYRRAHVFNCPLCVERKRDGEWITCAFDGREKLFKANHFSCYTILALKAAIRKVGQRALRDEERESRVTCWTCMTDSGRRITVMWKRGYGKGYVEMALEDLGPLSLEGAQEVIAMADRHSADAMGIDDDDYENTKERLGGDE